jgi:hypothetical protein
MRASHQPNYDYPEKTRGSEGARPIGASANKLTPSERIQLRRRAMQLIYTGPGKQDMIRSDFKPGRPLSGLGLRELVVVEQRLNLPWLQERPVADQRLR